MARHMLVAAVVFSQLAAVAGAQSAPPQVRVWLHPEGQLPYGVPVRVWFEVSQDAYVVIGRVSGDGRISVLYPLGAGPVLVRPGAPRLASNAGSNVPGSFRAAERAGYVFALASRSPIDIRALRNVFAGRYRASGWQDPDWLVQQLAAASLWDPAASYDYDIAYYWASLPYSYDRWSGLDCYPSLGSPRFRPGMPRHRGERYYNGGADGCWYYAPSNAERRSDRVQAPTPREEQVNLGMIRAGLWRPDTVSPVTERDPRLRQNGSGGPIRPPR
jgi:hypothetical protein